MNKECQAAIESQVLNKVLRKYEIKVDVWPSLRYAFAAAEVNFVG
jgi:hypothetical protein